MVKKRLYKAKNIKRAIRVNELIVCGGSEVNIFDIDNNRNGEFKNIYRWTAQKRLNLPKKTRGLFNSIDDCKPVDGGNSILITSAGDGVKTSSNGAVALVNRKDDSIIFSTIVTDAHSAEILPLGRIAVASSIGKNGNRIVIFDRNKPERPLYWDEVYSCHGAVWDEEKKLLWVLGYDQLRVYELYCWNSRNASLKYLAAFSLPGKNGHDLYAVPNSSLLTIAMERQVSNFDRNKRIFTAHPLLSSEHCVKSTSVNPITGQLAYIQASGKWWWAERICFLEPRKVIFVKGAHFYKARWNIK